MVFFSGFFKSGERSRRLINHVSSALRNRPRDGDLFRFIRSRGCGEFRVELCFLSFVLSFLEHSKSARLCLVFF